MNIQNNLARIRQRRGYSAADLAKKVGVSRQTIYAMEHGSYIPNTLVALKLSQMLEVKVEDLFALEEPVEAARTEVIELLPGDPPPQPGQPVQLCRVDQKMIGAAPMPVAWNFPPADAVLAEPEQGHTRVRLFQEDEPMDNRLLVAGCDPGISVLARHLRRAGVELVVTHRNSSQALRLLKQGWVHVAGSHLRDEASGESNLPAIRKLFPRSSVAVISFALWEEGIVVPKGNPKRTRDIADLARKGLKLVNREPGAGSRLLLDGHLKRLGIEPEKIEGYDRIAQGHLPAAWEVRAGHADACIATRAAARLFGLDFVSLTSERYDLVVRIHHLKLPALQLLFETLERTAFRRELEGLGGYDTSDTGKRMV